EHRGRLFRLANAVGDVALDRQGLKVAGDLLKDEAGVAAADRDRNQRCHGGVVEGRQAGAFTGHRTGAGFHQIGGELGLDEANAEHSGLLEPYKFVSWSGQLSKLHSTTKSAIVKPENSDLREEGQVSPGGRKCWTFQGP